MINILKYDFYKIFHSKVLRWTVIISTILCLLDPIIWYANGVTSQSVTSALRSPSTILPLAIMIFAALFSAKDFSSGYIKNISTRKDKLQYVLSKAIYIFLFTLFLQIVFIIYIILFHLIGADRFIMKYPLPPVNSITSTNWRYDNYTYGDVFLNMFLHVGLLSSLGLCIMFLSLLSKNEIIPIIAGMTYLMLFSGLLYSLFNDLFAIDLFREKYTLISQCTAYIEYNSTSLDLLISIAVIVFYSGISIMLSWLLMKRRRA
ncbi:MAG: hypothetical protein DBX59_12055 [Bacillota bacterium]|nr:MAG: hypothetical protein DBX59_12055 [Bacillota bacterium]